MKLSDIAKVHIGILKTRFESEDKKSFKYNIVDFSNISTSVKKEFLSKIKIDSKYLLQQNDLLVKLYPPISVYKVSDNHIGSVIPSNICVVRSQKIDSNLLYYLLKKKLFNIERLLDGGTINILKTKDLSNVKIDKSEITKNNLIKSQICLLYEKLEKLYIRKNQLLKIKKTHYLYK